MTFPLMNVSTMLFVAITTKSSSILTYHFSNPKSLFKQCNPDPEHAHQISCVKVASFSNFHTIVFIIATKAGCECVIQFGHENLNFYQIFIQSFFFQS